MDSGKDAGGSYRREYSEADRTEGKVQRASPESCRIELHVNIAERLEAARQRVRSEIQR